jgi:hypothetical protein
MTASLDGVEPLICLVDLVLIGTFDEPVHCLGGHRRSGGFLDWMACVAQGAARISNRVNTFPKENSRVPV